MDYKEQKEKSRLVFFLKVLIVFFVVFITCCAVYLHYELEVSASAQNAQYEVKNIPTAGGSYDTQRKPGVRNILVFGSDEVGENTDTILIANIDTENKRLNILHIPRDTLITDKNGKLTKKINSVYALGGYEGLENELKAMLGFEIDNYVHVTTTGLRKIVDKMGGVPIDVKQNMDYEDPDQGLFIHIKKGYQVLDGKNSEGFLRYRAGYAEADLGRIKAQKQWISALVNTLLTPQNIPKIPDIAKTVFENVGTDMMGQDIASLSIQAASIPKENITLFTLPGEPVGASFGVYKQESVELINKYFNVYIGDIEASKFKIAEFKRVLPFSQTDYKGTPVS